MSQTKAIVTENLGRTFKKKGSKEMDALIDINITVNAGEIFGFLGPNGAGKTTLIKIFTTLLYPSTGRAFVAGYDVVEQSRHVRPLINMVSGGETTGYGILTVEEHIWIFSQFYGVPSKVAKERIKFFLKRFELEDDAKTKINKLSTGMRQKMNIIRGLVTDPQILFLDEPTLGLDVHIARQVRDYIVDWISEKQEKTLFLTTHYMAEAEQLCDRIAIIDKGRIVACDTPRGLRKELGSESTYRIVMRPAPENIDMFTTLDMMSDPYIGRRDAAEDTLEVRFTMDQENGLTDVLGTIKDHGHQVVRFSKEEPTMEDLFMKIVGRKLEHGE